MILTLVGCGDKDKVGEGEAPSVSTEQGENDNDTEEDVNSDSEDEAEYKTLTTQEAIEFNNKTIDLMERLFNEKGFISKRVDTEYDGSLVGGPDYISYSIKNGAKPYYNSISYGTTINKDIIEFDYQFHYYVDAEKIKSGENEIPTSRKLLVVEPYKIMTGKDISNETLDKIDELIKEKYIDDRIHDEIILETVGPFDIKLILSTTGEISFVISYSEKGN